MPRKLSCMPQRLGQRSHNAHAACENQSTGIRHCRVFPHPWQRYHHDSGQNDGNGQFLKGFGNNGGNREFEISQRRVDSFFNDNNRDGQYRWRTQR